MRHRKNGARNGMHKVGVVASVLGAAAALATGVMVLASIPDLVRYVKIRRM